MAAISSLIVVIWYLIGQAVGAGQLLHTLVPQMSYRMSIVIVGVLIITLRYLRRHEGHDLGADHQGRPAVGRRVPDGVSA